MCFTVHFASDANNDAISLVDEKFCSLQYDAVDGFMAFLDGKFARWKDDAIDTIPLVDFKFWESDDIWLLFRASLSFVVVVQKKKPEDAKGIPWRII